MKLEDRIFQKEKLAFYRLRHTLLNNKQYRGKYVAIVDEKVVDSDTDKVALAKRVYDKKGYRTMYVGRVIEEETVLELPSPEL